MNKRSLKGGDSDIPRIIAIYLGGMQGKEHVIFIDPGFLSFCWCPGSSFEVSSKVNNFTVILIVFIKGVFSAKVHSQIVGRDFCFPCKSFVFHGIS